MTTPNGPGAQLADDTDAFAFFAGRGYGRLVPVVPPDAQMSPNSTLAKRKDARGKAVGIKGRDGLWRGMDWIGYEADEHDLSRWAAMGAGVGIKTGEGLVAIDADTLNAGHARTIRDIVEEHFGRLPVRVGRHPKALYVIRTSDAYRYTRVTFGENNERVEILSDGRQFVAHGIHPTTNAPYHWPRGIPHYDTLPIATASQLDKFMAALQAALPAAKEIEREGTKGERQNINQDALRGQIDHVRKAVAAIPNDERFDARESYIALGAAIKAALPDDPNTALEIWTEWAETWAEGPSRWPNGTFDPWVVEKDFQRLKPPFSVGASYIYDLAETHNPETFRQADIWFQPIPANDDEPNKNLSEPFLKDPAPNISATPYSFPDVSQLPRREWLYGGHYIRGFVSVTVAPSGVGKSSLAIVEALAMASGKPLLGVQPHGRFRVWLWNGEDPIRELQLRIGAAMQHYGLTREDIGENLFVDSGRDTEIVLATETRNGVVINEPVETAVLQTALVNRIDCTSVDPFVSSHRVTENDNGAIDLVSKRWARIADRARMSVELVHHVRKLNGGEITVEDGRGAVSLLATSRSARAIAKLTKGEAARMGWEAKVGRLFRFGDGKNNLAPPASADASWFELVSVAVGNGPGDGLDRVLGGDKVGVVTRFEGGSVAGGPLPDDARGAALTALRSGDWRRDPRAGEAWAGVAVAAAMGLDLSDASDKARAKDILSGFIKSGAVREVIRPDHNRVKRAFIEVVARSEDAENADTLSGGVFD